MTDLFLKLLQILKPTNLYLKINNISKKGKYILHLKIMTSPGCKIAY